MLLASLPFHGISHRSRRYSIRFVLQSILWFCFFFLPNHVYSGVIQCFSNHLSIGYHRNWWLSKKCFTGSRFLLCWVFILSYRTGVMHISGMMISHETRGCCQTHILHSSPFIFDKRKGRVQTLSETRTIQLLLRPYPRTPEISATTASQAWIHYWMRACRIASLASFASRLTCFSPQIFSSPTSFASATTLPSAQHALTALGYPFLSSPLAQSFLDYFREIGFHINFTWKNPFWNCRLPEHSLSRALLIKPDRIYCAYGERCCWF